MNSKPERRTTPQGITADFSLTLDLRRFLIWRVFAFFLLLLPAWTLAAEPQADPRIDQLQALITQAQQLQADIAAEPLRLQSPSAGALPPDQWPEMIERGRVLILGTEPDAAKVTWTLTVHPDREPPHHWGRLEPATVSGGPVLIVETLDCDWVVVSVARDVGEETLHTAAYVAITGDAPEPGPEPPIPLPPNKVAYGMIIEQRSDRGKLAPKQAFIFDNERIEKLFAPGHWRTIDLDKLGPDNTPPDEDIPLINRAKEIGRLPVLWLWDEDHKLICEKYGTNFPKDVDEAAALIQEPQR